MIAKAHLYFIVLFVFQTTLFSQTSPFGTGLINDVFLGEVENTSVIVPPATPYTYYTSYANSYLTEDTESRIGNWDNTYDLYIPASYDGTEPYGLILWINSGVNGRIRGAWKTVADEKKIIFIGANNLGNNAPTRHRISAAVASAYRAREIFNINENRIYASGSSGGARVATNLAYQFPEWIAGSLCLCGSSYFYEVEQDYQTRTGTYDRILTYTTEHLEYVKSFDQRYAIMTSYEDFREGNIMNIYHNGMEIDGFKAKFLEKEGTHCNTNTAQFRDALNFVEHSFTPVIEDDFSSQTPSTGNRYLLNSASIENNKLNLSETTSIGQLKTTDLFVWNDPKGAILKTTIEPTSNNASLNNTIFNLGIWEYSTPSLYTNFEGTPTNNTTAGIILSVDFSETQPILTIKMSNPNNSATTETVFTGTFDSSWTLEDQLKVKYHLWDNELRVEVNTHFTTATATMVDGVTLLNDRRSIQLEWNLMDSNGYWGDTQWNNGAFLTMTHQNANEVSTPENTLVSQLNIIAEEIIDPVSLSINKHEKEKNTFNIYPTITKENTTIVNQNFNPNQKTYLNIYNTSGQLIKTQHIQSKKESINLENIKKGIYFFKISNNSSTESIKIIKI